jgi:hypothetical protein
LAVEAHVAALVVLTAGLAEDVEVAISGVLFLGTPGREHREPEESEENLFGKAFGHSDSSHVVVSVTALVDRCGSAVKRTSATDSYRRERDAGHPTIG